MRKMGKVSVLLGITALFAIVVAAGPAAAKTEFVSIGTGGTGVAAVYFDRKANAAFVYLRIPDVRLGTVWGAALTKQSPTLR